MDNIVAIATPYGSGAISVIRASGPDSINLVERVFDRKLKREGYTISYGNIVNNGEIIDEVLVSVFKAPHSFDGEDCCEISCHGGILVTNLVLETLLDAGFRMAEPGEFSKRAFLNHKIDLTQSEAIMDIIAASNKMALKAAEGSLHSHTKKMIKELREEILNILASIEVNIDYPEYEDAITMDYHNIMPKVDLLIEKMKDILNNSRVAKIVREGIKVAIVGKPNVGKSSLLNMLLDEDKAIVSSIEGTTRDMVEGELSLNNVTLRFIDTAGIRNSDDFVEQIGIKRSIKAMNEADIVFVVLDSSRPLDDYDYKILEETKAKKRIIIYNKIDLNPAFKMDEEMIGISTSNKEGMTKLEERIEQMVHINEFNPIDNNYLANSRHISLMKKSLESLKNAKEGCLATLDSSLIEIDIKDAFDLLGEITGEAYDDELIDSLFSKFCLGK